MKILKKPLFLIWLFHQKAFKYICIIGLSFILLTVIASLCISGVLYYANRHGSLQTWINTAIAPVHVSYQKATVSWHYADPRVSLQGIQISDAKLGAAPLKLESFSIDFSLWSSLLRWNFVTDQLKISGLELQFQQNEDGSFDLAGMEKQSGSAQMNPETIHWILAQNGIDLTNVKVHLTLRNGQNLTFTFHDINWRRRLKYYFALNGSIDEIPLISFDVNGSLENEGDPLIFTDWQGKAEGSLVAKDFTPLFAQNAFHHVSWLAGGGNVNFDGTMEAGALKSLTAYLDLNSIKLSHAKVKNIFQSNFDEIFFWQAKKAGGWQLEVTRAQKEENPVLDSLKIDYAPGQIPEWQVKAKNIDLEVLGQWINFWFSPKSSIFKSWKILMPEGRLTALDLDAGAGQHGSLSIEADPFAFGRGDLFANAWPAGKFGLTMRWQPGAKAKSLAEIQIQNLQFVNKWLTVNMAGSVSLPMQNTKPILNLTGSISGQNLEQIKTSLIPQSYIPKALQDWLMQGLIKLPKLEGTFRLKGQVDDLPFGKNKSTTDVRLHVTDATIEPWSKWPDITGLNGDLLFLNQMLDVRATSATTMGVPLNNVHLVVQNLRSKPVSPMIISGEATPSGEQSLTYLAAMPIISASVSSWLKTIVISGKLPLHLKIIIPFAGQQGIHVQGEVKLSGNNWALTKTSEPLFNDIQGILYFDNDKVRANRLTFTAFNQNLAIKILPSLITYLEIMAEKVFFLNQTFSNLPIQVYSDKEGTVLRFNHPLVKGKLIIPGNDQPITGVFSEFHLPLLQSSSLISTDNMVVPASGQGENSLLGLTLSSLPSLRLTIETLYYGKNPLGQFYWQSSPLVHGIKIQHINLTSNDIALVVAAQIRTLNNTDHFKVEGDLASKNYGDLLTKLNYPGVLNEGQGKVAFNLNWQGKSMNFDRSSVNGAVSFNLSSGKLLQVDAGFLRIFGLVSLDTIFSTLSFNFQKILSKGVIFNSVTGDYTIHQGIAKTNAEGLKIIGPSLNLIMKGQMNLADQTLDQTAVVMPQVGNSIAIAAAALGGPVIGLATWLADKVIANTILRDTGINLHITGSINDPKVSMLKGSAES